MDGMDSVSLWSALRGGRVQEEVVVSQLEAWRIAVKEFNSSATLKLVCCPGGCPETLSLPAASQRWLLLNVTEDKDEVLNVTGGQAEVQELLNTMPERFIENCSKSTTQPA